MEKIPKDVLVLIAIELDIHSLLRFCATDKRNQNLCNNPFLWIAKLKKDFGFVFKGDISKAKHHYFYILAHLNTHNLNGGMLFAIKDGNDDIAKYFISKGADDLEEALSWAARYGRKEIIDFVIPKVTTKIDWRKLISHASAGGQRQLVGDFLDKLYL